MRLKVEHRTSTSLSRDHGFTFLCFCLQELQQKEQQWRRRCEELQVQVQQLQQDRNELHDRLKGNHAEEGRFHSLPLKYESVRYLVTGLTGSLRVA